jgi:phosphoglycolate phosphatase-like HAD superfamily hydrolase
MNVNISRAVFFDFDGVLFDTVREAYAVAMVALGNSIRIADVDFSSRYFQKFSQCRHLIGPAWNYYYLMRSIYKESARSTADLEAKYKNSLDQRIQGEYLSFEKNFFQARKKIRETERDHWLSLIFPYSIVEDVRILMSEFKGHFFLVTTRDRESVLDLLELHNLDIPEFNIFTKKEYALYNSKVNIIQDLIRKHQIEKSLFIDDLEEHLVACRTIESLTTIQAKWGYVVPAKKEDNSAFLLKKLESFIYGENVRA